MKATIKHRREIMRKIVNEDPVGATFDCAAIALYGCLLDELTPAQEAEMSELTDEEIVEKSQEVTSALGVNPTKPPS